MPSAFQDGLIATWLEYTKGGGAKKQKKAVFSKMVAQSALFQQFGPTFCYFVCAENED